MPIAAVFPTNVSAEPRWEQIIVERLDRQIELLAELTGVLVTKRYRVSQWANEDGTGRALVEFPARPGGTNLVWLIDRVAISTTSVNGNETFGLYIMDARPITPGNLDDSYLADWTNIGPKSIADELQPIPVKGGEVVLGQWQGLSTGTTCTCRLQFRQGWQAEE